MPEQRFNCGKCNAPLVGNIPEPKVSNVANLSQVYGTYEQGVECPACGMYYVPIIQGAQVQWAWAGVEKPKDAPKIVQASAIPKLKQ
jgi:Zn finger protein HypA/HybF involved in hydrogenase expression